ncbi:MAG: hypothetical protein COB85_05160, partial [Bacteroidetes bacterium]
TSASANGCDSVRITNLTLLPDTVLTINTGICTGDSLFVGGAYQTTAGAYYDTSAAANSCDSIRITNLSVDSIIINNLNPTICSGDSLMAGGTYQTTTGTYFDTLTSSGGCDSIVTTNLSVIQDTTVNLSVSICTGDSLLIGGAYQNTAGTYYDSLSGANGCDSVRITSLSVLTDTTNSISVNICTGDSVLAGGGYQNSSGSYFDTLIAANGCDSILTMNLFVLSDTTVTLNAGICTGDSLLVGGSFQFSSGTYYDTFSAANGCDSVRITNLTVDSILLTTLNVSLCKGDSVLAGGSYQTTSGTYYDSLIASAGCDSVVITNLLISPTMIALQFISICSGDSLFTGGGYQTSTGYYYDTVFAVNGCDSTIFITDLIVLPSPVVSAGTDITIIGGSSIQLTGSGGPSYSWTPSAGLSCTACADPIANPEVTTTYYLSVIDANNCTGSDSILITVVNVAEIFIPNLFSPNADNVNDIFYIRGNGIDQLEIIIYDRWGEKIFDGAKADIWAADGTYPTNVGWDGTYKGKPMNQAVFVYVVKGAFSNGELIDEKGNITLIR